MADKSIRADAFMISSRHDGTDQRPTAPLGARPGRLAAVHLLRPGGGERIELSGVSFANWVDKTSNLLVEELDVQPGGAVDLALAKAHPGHWVTLVWVLSCWQVGAVVTVDQPARPSPCSARTTPKRLAPRRCWSARRTRWGCPWPDRRRRASSTTRWRSGPARPARGHAQSGLPSAWRDGTGSSPRPTWSRRADRAAAGWSGRPIPGRRRVPPWSSRCSAAGRRSW